MQVSAEFIFSRRRYADFRINMLFAQKTLTEQILKIECRELSIYSATGADCLLRNRCQQIPIQGYAVENERTIHEVGGLPM